ncbi:hypothetical protein Tco_1554588 [Tanacetum coccineum]
MVGSLMYLSASIPNLVFAICMCARYQASPTKKHLEALKRVFRYLRGTINWGLWYPKDTAMALMAYADADNADTLDEETPDDTLHLLKDSKDWSSGKKWRKLNKSFQLKLVVLICRQMKDCSLGDQLRTMVISGNTGLWEISNALERRTPTTTEPSGNAESPSLDVELAIADSETESFKNPNKSDEEVTLVNKEKDASNKELTKINDGVQDEGQDGSDPGKQDEGQTGSNHGNAAVFQPQPSHVVHAVPNLEPMDLAVSDSSTQQNPDSTGTLSSLQHLEKELSFTDQFFVEKPQEEEPEKTNAESEVQTMVTVPIHQDTSSAPPMTTPVIDLTTSQEDSPTVHAPPPTSTTTTTIITTTTLPPPLLQPQHSTIDPILIRCIGELEQNMANLIQDNSALEESSRAPSSSKTVASTQQSLAWTTSKTRYKSATFTATQETSPTNNMINDDSIPDEQASALVSTYEPPAENSLLLKTGDMTTFMNWLTLSISKMKAARYPDFGLELLVPEQMWIDVVCTYDISVAYGISHWWFNRQKFYIERHDSPSHRREVTKHMRILSVVRIKAYLRYGYDYLSKILLRRADYQEYTITEKDFKNMYPSNFEDLNLLLLQGHLDHLPGSDKRMLSTAVKLWTQNLFSDGTLTRILEALDYRVKEFKIKRLNPGMNTRFWTQKDVTRSKEFMSAIKRRLKTRRIYQNLECFVGGRVRDIDYRLLQRMK